MWFRTRLDRLPIENLDDLLPGKKPHRLGSLHCGDPMVEQLAAPEWSIKSRCYPPSSRFRSRTTSGGDHPPDRQKSSASRHPSAVRTAQPRSARRRSSSETRLDPTPRPCEAGDTTSSLRYARKPTSWPQTKPSMMSASS